MYRGDSFFTLSLGGQAGLLLLSVLLAIALWLLARWVMRSKGLLFRMAVAVVCYVLFVWLSPQIYYGYYWLIFDALPVQWVIGLPPTDAIWRNAVFLGDRTLSAHGQGVLFWMLVVAAIRASEPSGPAP